MLGLSVSSERKSSGAAFFLCGEIRAMALYSLSSCGCPIYSESTRTPFRALHFHSKKIAHFATPFRALHFHSKKQVHFVPKKGLANRKICRAEHGGEAKVEAKDQAKDEAKDEAEEEFEQWSPIVLVENPSDVQLVDPTEKERDYPRFDTQFNLGFVKEGEVGRILQKMPWDDLDDFKTYTIIIKKLPPSDLDEFDQDWEEIMQAKHCEPVDKVDKKLLRRWLIRFARWDFGIQRRYFKPLQEGDELGKLRELDEKCKRRLEKMGDYFKS